MSKPLFTPQPFELKNPALILSVDVESWEEANLNFKLPSKFTVVRQVEKTLNLLALHQCRATFFILGKVAETFPHLVKSIVSAGHEVACHSFFHQRIYRQKPLEFKADVLRAKEILESLAEQKVLGFRAPRFSITRKSLWALPILAQAGFAYDSSLVPVRAFGYGFAGGREGACRLNFDNGAALIELPPSTIELFGFRFPMGGAYFKIFPQLPFIKTLEDCRNQNRSAVFYFHPHELETLPPQSELKNAPLWLYWRENMGRAKMPEKLEFLLSNFHFAPFKEALEL